MQLYILDRNKNTVATTNAYYDDEHTQTLGAGSSPFKFTVTKRNRAAKDIDENKIVAFKDPQGRNWSMSVVNVDEDHSTKTITAYDVGIELMNKACDVYKADQAYSFEYYFNKFTEGTPWTLGKNELSGLSRKLEWTGRETGLGRLLSLLTEFDNAECVFNVEFSASHPIKYIVDVYKQQGNPNTGKVFTFGNEIDNFKVTSSRSEFVTAICGVGGTPTKNADGTDIVQATNADGTTVEIPKIDFSDLEYDDGEFRTTKGDPFLYAYKANAELNPNPDNLYIEDFYDYDTTDPQELLNRTLTKLKTYSQIQRSYEVDMIKVDPTLRIGDTVKLIDQKFNPPLYLQARVSQLVKSYKDKTKNTVTFSNYQLLTDDDRLRQMNAILNAMPSGSEITNIVANTVNVWGAEVEKRIVALTSADGKSTVFYDAKPSNAKEGDTAFVKNPDSGNMEIWNFVNGEWTLTIGDATVADLKKLINDSQAETKKAVDDVNAKVNAANEELTKANAEIDKLGINHDELVKIVDGVKSDASTAGQNALDALATAKTDLTKNLNKEITDRANAVTALDTKAKGYADTAKADAISASTTADGAINKKIDDTASSITSTISQNKTDADGKITTAQSTATQALNGLATKVSQTAYDTKTGQLQTDLNTTTTTANQAKTDIVAIKKTNTDQDTRMTTIESDANGVKTTVSSLQTTANTQAGSISTLQQRADGFDATVATLGQINQLFNTEFSPDLQGWKTVRDPFVLSGSYNGSNQLLSTATTSSNRLYADLIYVKDVPVISFSVVNDSWVIVRGYGQDRKLLRELYSQLRTGYGLNKMENKAIPSDVYYVEFGFQSSAGGYVSQPMLTFSDKVGKYVQGNYNNNASVAKAQLTADNASLALSNYKTDADGRISKAQADIIVNANAITQKVSQSDYNAKTGDLTTKVNTAQSTADSATSTIGSYKTSNDGRVASAESKINQNTSAIELRVLKTDLSGAVNGLAKETYVDAQIKIKADEINSTVAKSITSATSGLATVTALTSVKQSADAWGVVAQQNKTDIANLTVTANGLKSTIANVATKDELTQTANSLNNVISGSDDFVQKAWFDDGNAGTWLDGQIGTDANVQKLTGHSNYLKTNRRDCYENQNILRSVSPGEVYYIDSYMSALGTSHEVSIGMHFRTTSGGHVWLSAAATPAGTKMKKFTGKVTVPSDATTGEVWLHIEGTSNFGYASFLGMRVSRNPTSSQFQQLQDQISLRVTADQVTTSVAVTTKAILLNGADTYITGNTHIANSVIQSAMIKDASITNAKIANLAVQDANIASLNGAKIVAGSITANQMAADAFLVGLNSSMSQIQMQPNLITIDTSYGRGTLGASGLTFGAKGDSINLSSIYFKLMHRENGSDNFPTLGISGNVQFEANIYGKATLNAEQPHVHFESCNINGDGGMALVNDIGAGIYIMNSGAVWVGRSFSNVRLLN